MCKLLKLFGAGWKDTSLGLMIPALTQTKKASLKLPAAAGKFSQVTSRNKGHSLPGQISACICRWFYLRNSLQMAIAIKFAPSSFTVWFRNKTINRWKKILGKFWFLKRPETCLNKVWAQKWSKDNPKKIQKWLFNQFWLTNCKTLWNRRVQNYLRWEQVNFFAGESTYRCG